MHRNDTHHKGSIPALNLSTKRTVAARGAFYLSTALATQPNPTSPS
jgi:hypothetical protein